MIANSLRRLRAGLVLNVLTVFTAHAGWINICLSHAPTQVFRYVVEGGEPPFEPLDDTTPIDCVLGMYRLNKDGVHSGRNQLRLSSQELGLAVKAHLEVARRSSNLKTRVAERLLYAEIYRHASYRSLIEPLMADTQLQKQWQILVLAADGDPAAALEVRRSWFELSSDLVLREFPQNPQHLFPLPDNLSVQQARRRLGSYAIQYRIVESLIQHPEWIDANVLRLLNDRSLKKLLVFAKIPTTPTPPDIEMGSWFSRSLPRDLRPEDVRGSTVWASMVVDELASRSAR